jgi:hypothetical protein
MCEQIARNCPLETAVRHEPHRRVPHFATRDNIRRNVLDVLGYDNFSASLRTRDFYAGFISETCEIRDEARRIAANIVRLLGFTPGD